MRLLLIWLVFATLSTALEAVKMEEGVWEVLEGCQIVNSADNDGDSFRVKYGNEEFSFRLYYVDAPETTETYIGRVRDQARYFAIEETEVVATGKLAAAFTKKFLGKDFTLITKWEDARGGSKTKRYFALARKDDQYLSTELMLAGLARLYGTPTEESWPGGVTPRTFLGRLKNNERNAQREERGIWALASGSMQMAGLEALAKETVGESFIDPPSVAQISAKDRINVNTASSEELETLPGIGPALAASIIGARPITSIESLVQIPGISDGKLSAFSHMIITEEPPPPEFTVAFYQAEIDKHLDKNIIVRVSSISQSEAESPETFRAVTIHTANNGEDGGSITSFIPDEFYDSFLNYYREPGREFTGLLYSREGEIVLVYQRK